jgi:hypothetical protein
MITAFEASLLLSDREASSLGEEDDDINANLDPSLLHLDVAE